MRDACSIQGLPSDTEGPHLDVGVLGELVCAGEAGRAGSNNDDISLCILVQVLEVPAGHCAADLQQNRRNSDNEISQCGWYCNFTMYTVYECQRNSFMKDQMVICGQSVAYMDQAKIDKACATAEDEAHTWCSVMGLNLKSSKGVSERVWLSLWASAARATIL